MISRLGRVPPERRSLDRVPVEQTRSSQPRHEVGARSPRPRVLGPEEVDTHDGATRVALVWIEPPHLGVDNSQENVGPHCLIIETELFHPSVDLA